MKKVITYGTFDLFHQGHVNLLKRAKNLGDYLIVGLSTEGFNDKKDKEAIYSYDERKTIIKSIKFVDEVIPEKRWGQKISDIKDNNVDVFVIGEDWEGEFNYLKQHCQVIYLPRTPNISTTIIKKRLS